MNYILYSTKPWWQKTLAVHNQPADILSTNKCNAANTLMFLLPKYIWVAVH